jgi:hypothetical protein
MTAPAPLAFPGSRVLAGWSRQLGALHPQGLWVAHLLLHRVEALVRLSRTVGLDPFHRLILQAIRLSPSPTLSRLDETLHLGPQLLNRALAALQAERLATSTADRCWTLTALGQTALECDEYPRPVHERRLFTFLHGSPPHYLNLGPAATVPCPPPEGFAFDPTLLQACVAQPADWKQRYGFPTDVQEVSIAVPDSSTPGHSGGLVAAAGAGSAPPAWQHVIVDRPERLLGVLVLASGPDGQLRLLGYPVKQDGWVLHAEPVLALSAGWEALFPELLQPPAHEAWRQAWRLWCQPRGLTGAETETCPLTAEGTRLRAEVPARVMDKLRSTRSDALRGEAWLLAGEGRIRTAVQLEIVEARPRTPSSTL